MGPLTPCYCVCCRTSRRPVPPAPVRPSAEASDTFAKFVSAFGLARAIVLLDAVGLPQATADALIRIYAEANFGKTGDRFIL